MDVFLIIIVCVLALLLMYVNVYLLALYCHPEDGGFGSSFFCKIVVVLGLTLSWCQTLMLTLDVTNERNQQGLDMHLCWIIIYISVFVMLVFLIPIAIFYYESDDEKPICQRITLTLVQEFMVLVFAFLTIFLTYFWLRDALVPVTVQVQDATLQFQSSELDLNIDTFTITEEKQDHIATTIDPITFTIGLMCFLGYFFLILYGGIGMVALPLDLVCSYGTRPVFKSAAQATEKKNRLKRVVAQMIGYAKKLRDMEKDVKCASGWWSKRKQNSKVEKKYQKLVAAVSELEEECEIFLLELDIGNANPLVYIFKLLLGIILFIITLTWLLHILLYVIITIDGIPFSPWLNKLFIQLDAYNVAFLSVFFFGLFTLYLLWCVTKGNLVFSMPWIFKFHPMKINETWMNSFLFNIVLILISSVALCHFSTCVFSQYTRLTTVDLLFGTQIKYLKIFSWAFENKVFEYSLFSWTIFAGIIQMILKCRKPKLIDQIDQRKKNLKGNYEIELKELFLK
ncbi:unnamed protein product [Paramecium primaurelia]|uniref:LMBR1 domain-containing protein 1 n=1 Tax=Paramecium primaurelia TaxID=5886 RepID=A0A8S1N1A2_PARPR|nr:unnamed protein product [Paramecium primaurelia]